MHKNLHHRLLSCCTLCESSAQEAETGDLKPHSGLLCGGLSEQHQKVTELEPSLSRVPTLLVFAIRASRNDSREVELDPTEYWDCATLKGDD